MGIVAANHIEAHPDRCGGRPCIVGTRICVQDIGCDHEMHGPTPEQIAREYPQVTLAQVHAALAYYFDHREEVQRQIKEDAEFAVVQATEARSGVHSAA